MPSRDLDLNALILQRNAHPNPEAGMCIMEAVAYVAGEPHSDHPACASPTISAFLRNWNDRLDDEGRQSLKPYVQRLVGSRSTDAIELQRSYMASDWLNRVVAPAFLELAGCKKEADELRALVPTLDRNTCLAALPALRRARSAGAAAWAAAWAAARAKLAPVVKQLQASAHELLDRMLRIGGDYGKGAGR